MAAATAFTGTTSSTSTDANVNATGGSLSQGAALDDALAMIDAWEDSEFDWLLGCVGTTEPASASGASDTDGNEANTASMSTSPSGALSPAATPIANHVPTTPTVVEKTLATDPTTATKKRRRGNPRRLEILYLRDKVAELEGALGDAQRKHEEMLIAAETADPAQVQAWEEIATRQRNQRERAESDNRKLRQVMESQVKVARELMVLLQRQPSLEGLTEQRSAKRVQLRRGDDHEVTVEEQFRHLEQLYQQQRICELPTTSQERSYRDIHVRDDGMAGAILEMKVGWVLPFALSEVADAVWDSSVRNFLRRRTKEVEEILNTRDTHIARFTDCVDVSTGGTFSVYGRCVNRRYEVAPDHVLMVSDIRIRPTTVDSNHYMSSFVVHATGYTRVVPFVSADSRQPRLTRVEWVRSIQVRPVMALPGQTTSRIGAFTDFVLNHVTEGLELAQQLAEDALIQGNVGDLAGDLAELLDIDVTSMVQF